MSGEVSMVIIGGLQAFVLFLTVRAIKANG
jgi:hypothetical protein